MVRWGRRQPAGARPDGRRDERAWTTRRSGVLAAVLVGVVLTGGCSAGTSVDAGQAPGRDHGGSGKGSNSAPADPGSAAGVPLGGVQRELIRSAQVRVEVDDAVARTRQVRAAAVAVGGLVVEEQSADRSAWLTLRVPADSLDRLVDDVGGLGRVVDRSTRVSDVTEDVVDLDARVASQRTSVDRVRALLAQAQSIGDIVSIEAELAKREADLDSLTARLGALRDQVAMSTLTVDLYQPGAPAGAPGTGGFTNGLAAGWAGLLAVGTAAAAVAGFLLPLLPLVAVVLGIIWLVRRTTRGRRTPDPAPAPAAAVPPASGPSGGA
jgi:hypothetical protein